MHTKTTSIEILLSAEAEALINEGRGRQAGRQAGGDSLCLVLYIPVEIKELEKILQFSSMDHFFGSVKYNFLVQFI